MIRVDVIKGSKTTKLYFETRDTSSSGLDELDEAYQIVLGSMPRRGGYTDSNRFEVEILNDEE